MRKPSWVIILSEFDRIKVCECDKGGVVEEVAVGVAIERVQKRRKGKKKIDVSHYSSDSK